VWAGHLAAQKWLEREHHGKNMRKSWENHGKIANIMAKWPAHGVNACKC